VSNQRRKVVDPLAMFSQRRMYLEEIDEQKRQEIYDREKYPPLKLKKRKLKQADPALPLKPVKRGRGRPRKHALIELPLPSIPTPVESPLPTHDVAAKEIQKETEPEKFELTDPSTLLGLFLR
jgi:hypothetical protein